MERADFEAKIVLDSLSPQGLRLTTFECTFPRFILPEVNTHRVLSKNSGSSRAIPLAKTLEKVMQAPYIPSQWGKNQPGMQADTHLQGEDARKAAKLWLQVRDSAVAAVKEMALLGGTGVHKQLANRLLEPFAWHTVLMSGTDWRNFFALRTHRDAQPEIQEVARLMLEAYINSNPQELSAGQWHLPLVDPLEMQDEGIEYWKKVSVGRCARVSYLTHDGKRDTEKDVSLHDILLKSGHMSPFEHVATPMSDAEYVFSQYSGNFRGFKQYRKEIPNEGDYANVLGELGRDQDAQLLDFLNTLV